VWDYVRAAEERPDEVLDGEVVDHFGWNQLVRCGVADAARCVTLRAFRAMGVVEGIWCGQVLGVVVCNAIVGTNL